MSDHLPRTGDLLEAIRDRLRGIASAADAGVHQADIARMAREGLALRPEEVRPSFTLEASDPMAPVLILNWIASYGAHVGGLPEEKLVGAWSVLQAIERWQSEHPDLVKKPD